MATPSPLRSFRALTRTLLVLAAMLGPLLVPSARAEAQGGVAVRINEFVAANQTGFVDNTGELEDGLLIAQCDVDIANTFCPD